MAFLRLAGLRFAVFLDAVLRRAGFFLAAIFRLAVFFLVAFRLAGILRLADFFLVAFRLAGILRAVLRLAILRLVAVFFLVGIKFIY